MAEVTTFIPDVSAASATKGERTMSAQKTITRSRRRTHSGLLAAGILAAAVAIAGLGLAVSLLAQTPIAPSSQPAPSFDANRFRAEERQPLGFGTPAPQHEPFPWNR